MSDYRNRAPARNHHYDPFNWSHQLSVGPPSFAVRKIARQYGVSLSHAKAIVNIAGIGPEVTR